MPNQFNSPEGDLENYFVSESWLIDQWVGDTLWTWGRNDAGQLGVNDTNTRCTPVTTFAGGTNWKQVIGGWFHTAAIKTDGTLWTWGSGTFGQLGINISGASRSTPVPVFGGGTNWKQVSAGYRHTAAIKTDGTLWTWGNNSYGEIGNNTTTQILTPVQTFVGGTNWKQVSCGRSHTLAIKTDGTLWTWGNGSNGRLGDNTSGTNRLTPVPVFGGGTNWKQVSAGYRQASAIKTDGTLWTWGNNSYGQLGVNDTNTRCTPVQTSAGGNNWKQVSCGGGHTAAIKTDGTLWTWGGNLMGQIGDNTSGTNRLTPVPVFGAGTNWKQVFPGGENSAAIKTDGTLWVWGRNNFGQIGDNTSGINRLTPITTFAGGTNWKQVSAGYFHTTAVTSGTDPTYFIS
jgi:alpha-tubulin suppressor-like RCC1 family protein